VRYNEVSQNAKLEDVLNATKIFHVRLESLAGWKHLLHLRLMKIDTLNVERCKDID